MNICRPLAISLAVALLMAGSISRAKAQAAAPAPPQFAVMAGLGNLFGGIGVAGEYHAANGLIGLSAGVGFMPPHAPFERDFGAAAAVRIYTGRGRHALFGQAAVVPVLQRWSSLDQDVLYGPALSIGYRYLAARGFTAMIDAGAGWASHDTELVGSIGFGYRWRR